MWDDRAMGTDGKILTGEQIEQYRELGFCSPVTVLSADEAAAARAQLEAHEANLGRQIGPDQRSKSHYLFTWVDDLMRNDRILDAVEDLIGPNILCWGSIFWIKEPHTPSYVGWHQDLQYWGLDTDDLVNVWVALAPASEAAGCMSVLPGSHRERLDHVETYHQDNMLTRGQELTIDIGSRSPIPMPLEPGQISLHNGRSAHGSGPNTTDDRRIGLSFQYMPTSAKQTLVDWDTAALVRGIDDYNHFEHGARPESDLHPDAVAFHARAAQALRDLIYIGAERDSTSTL
jgi:ectoine hydroxylase-related dioxygenase (phytanoyl-CoA dioxygenase family)